MPTKPAIAVAGPRQPRQMPAIWSGGPELRRIRLPETLAAGVPMITNRGIAGHGETNVDAPGGLERWLGSNQGRISSTGSAGLGNLWQPALDRSTGRSDRSCRCSPCRLAGGTGMTVAAFTTHAALIAVMQPGSMLNPKPAIGGRWYGPGSPTFAVYTAATGVLVGYMAHRLGPPLPRWRGQGGLDPHRVCTAEAGKGCWRKSGRQPAGQFRIVGSNEHSGSVRHL